MRVLHWYPNFLGGGGVANAVLGLAAGQTRLGAKVAVAAFVSPGSPLYDAMQEEDIVDVIKWKPQWTLHVQSFLLRGIPLQAIRHLRDFRPEIVHVHGEFNPDNWWVPHLFKLPIVLSPHGTFHPVTFTKNRKAAKKIYFRAAHLLLYRYVRAFHALSPMECKHFPRVLPGSRVYCVPQGPSIRTQDYLTLESGKNPQGIVQFLFVGRLDVYTKGLDILLDAFVAATECINEHQITLTLIGPGWKGGETWLQRRAEELGIAGRVIFTGPIRGMQVGTALRNADIYIQLSRHDSFPLSVAEALLAGRPAILSQAIGLVSYPEVCSLPHVRVVQPNVNEAKEAIVDFVQRLEDLKETAVQCQVRVRDFFSWERISRLHLKMYEILGDVSL